MNHDIQAVPAAAREQVDIAVRRLVGAYAPDPVPLADAGHTLLGDLGFSSLRLIELAFTLEELFEMDPAAMGEAPPTGTVAAIRDFLLAKVSSGQASVPRTGAVDAVIALL